MGFVKMLCCVMDKQTAAKFPILGGLGYNLADFGS